MSPKLSHRFFIHTETAITNFRTEAFRNFENRKRYYDYEKTRKRYIDSRKCQLGSSCISSVLPSVPPWLVFVSRQTLTQKVKDNNHAGGWSWVLGVRLRRTVRWFAPRPAAGSCFRRHVVSRAAICRLTHSSPQYLADSPVSTIHATTLKRLRCNLVTE